MIAKLALLAASFGSTVNSPGAEDAPGFAADNFYSSLVNVVIILAAVIGLIVVLIRFLAVKTSRWSAGKTLRVHAGVQLGQNKSLQVIEIGGVIYIVGVGENVTLLDRIDDPAQAKALVDALSAQTMPAMGAGFEGVSSLWRRLTRKGGGARAAADEELSAEAFRELLADKMRAAGAKRGRLETWMEEEER